MLSSIWQYVSGALGMLLVILIGYTYVTVNGLKLELSETKSDMIAKIAESNMCRVALSKQNADVEAVKANYVKAVVSLKKWKAKPAEIRYNTVYKYIPREVLTNEDSCENTEAYIDAIRNIDYDRL